MLPSMNGGPLKTCPWKNRTWVLCLFVMIVSTAFSYLISYDFRYMVDTGISVLNRGDACSIERFLYTYGAGGPMVYTTLVTISILVPGSWLCPLYAAGHGLFSQPSALISSFAGNFLGTALLLGISKILLFKIRNLHHRLMATVPDSLPIPSVSIHMFLAAIAISPLISTQLFWISIVLSGLGRSNHSLVIFWGFSGLSIFHLIAIFQLPFPGLVNM